MRYGKDDPEREESDRRLRGQQENIIESNMERYKKAETIEEKYKCLKAMEDAFEVLDMHAIDYNLNLRREVKKRIDTYEQIKNKKDSSDDNEEPEL